MTGFITSTVIPSLIIVLLVGLALRYIIREKKRGVKCIGCPMAGSCTKCGHGDAPTQEEIQALIEQKQHEKAVRQARESAAL